MIIDATDLILGRMASVVAKKVLLGQEIVIVNSDKAVLTGSKKDIESKYYIRRNRGGALMGPFFPKQSDRLVKRAIRGMLPYKQPKGIAAFKRVICFKGLPDEFKDKKIETIKEVHVSKVKQTGHVTVGNVCKFLGGK
ncbi:MAG: 50S ribosomal protein L13 [archaeon]